LSVHLELFSDFYSLKSKEGDQIHRCGSQIVHTLPDLQQMTLGRKTFVRKRKGESLSQHSLALSNLHPLLTLTTHLIPYHNPRTNHTPLQGHTQYGHQAYIDGGDRPAGSMPGSRCRSPSVSVPKSFGQCHPPYSSSRPAETGSMAVQRGCSTPCRSHWQYCLIHVLF
jgi:hypothetical protein